MGCSPSKAAEDTLNDVVGKKMRQDEASAKHKLKLLLLGAGDSGKTTIFKQMRILYGEGYSEEKRAALRQTVVNNLIVGAKAIIKASIKGVAGKPLEGNARLAAEIVMEVKGNEAELTEGLATAIASLWADSDFQATWADRSKFQVLDGWEDFAKQVKGYPEWGGPEWVPSISDSIRARARTCGIVEKEFHVDGINFTLIDVGGQRNERRKWIHCFEGVTAVIFVAAISEYDQRLFEDRYKNRLMESLDLFQEVCEMEWFSRTNFVLFLNKSDLFQNKFCLRKVPINVSGLFPTAPNNFDFDEGVGWMRNMFLARSKDQSRSIFSHVTNATDTYNVRVVFDACKDAILRTSLAELGFLSI